MEEKNRGWNTYIQQKEIANYLFNKMLEETTTGNYILSKREIIRTAKEVFDVELIEEKDFITILAIIFEDEEHKKCINCYELIEPSEEEEDIYDFEKFYFEFDVYFYTEFCPNVIQEEEEEA